MKEIEGIEYFDVADISEMFHGKMSEDELRKYFEDGKIKGKKIDNKWHADNDYIEDFMKVLKDERCFTIGPLDIDISSIDMKGRILDIGGGGEGVIGLCKGEQVVAIDYNKKELEEAPESKALNIVMDAKDLKFLDNTFDSAAAFFTIMYIPLADHKKIFQEIFRVLKPRGEFFLWELIIPNRSGNEKDIYLIYLKVKISENIIGTGYGVKWDKEQDENHFLSLAKEVGFEVIEQKVEENVFYLKFKKP